MKNKERQSTTSLTPRRLKYEQPRRQPPQPYAYNRACGRNRRTSNEPLEKTPQVTGEAAEEAAEEATEEAVVVAVETPPLQEGCPQATPEEETTDFSDNPRTYSLETA